MTPELTVLTLAALLQIAQLIIMVIPANLQLGVRKTLSSRDADRLGKPLIDQVGTRTARAFRAYNNHFESLALFTIAVVVITLSDQSTNFTAQCAWVYLVARIVYVPAYILGLSPWRSIVWMIAMLASVSMLISALL